MRLSRLPALWPLLLLALPTAAFGLATNLASDMLPSWLGRWAIWALIPLAVLMVAAGGLQIKRDAGGRDARARRIAARRVNAVLSNKLGRAVDNVPVIPVKLAGRSDLAQGSPADPGPADVSALFRLCGESLLVVGDGGVGKTVMLMQLCATLCLQAEQDDDPDLAVYLGLESWDSRHGAFDDWVVTQAAVNYKIDKETVRACLDSSRLVIVIDGLDEISGLRRRQVVAAMGMFQTAHLARIAVGCRTKQYQALRTPLTVTAAVEVLAPTQEQALEYLRNLQRPAATAVASVPSTDRAWWDMVRTPLMLSIVARVSASNPNVQLVRRGSARQRRDHVLNTYVDELLARRGRQTRYPAADARRWLEWLAWWLTANDAASLTVDRLPSAWAGQIPDSDPDTMMGSPLRLLQRGLRLTILVWGLTQFVVLAVSGRVSLVALLISAISSGLVYATTANHVNRNYANNQRYIQPLWNLTTLRVVWTERVSVVGVSLLAVMIPIVLLKELLTGIRVPYAALISICGTCTLLYLPGLLTIDSPKRLRETTAVSPGEQLRRSAANAMFMTIAVAVPALVTAAVLSGVRTHSWGYSLVLVLPMTPVTVAGYWLAFGGAPVVQYQYVRNKIVAAGYGPPHYLRFLRWSQDQQILTCAGDAFQFPHREIQGFLARCWRPAFTGE
ncbi:hypothetical protein GCM10020358_55850 [Amorphoplanes nipponensis]|uniref:NACHT domain-containing protein n=1 Tax=Actinoplanes nipponensis TaxID=135950 RepID=A0A919MNU1_9ACTN|nr:hypothetical protein [Actinoplanes nipponensis]GIE51921.1 hypothetical protein Ani05nite_54550 [Actinoplanes nipponensis]